jgi:peptidoglycan/xylan/chitin deacetylase (PgdA/CDA1 family)
MRIHLHDSHYGSHIVWSIFIGLLVYIIIPTAIVRLGGFGAYRKGKRATGIALTFDDGPDPAFTPQLLDILKLHGIQATFFVLGVKAEKYPELIRRMHAEGHLIGIHNYNHWTNALLTPKKVRKQLQETVMVIEKIIGVTPIHYRPPWGIINLFDFLLMKQFQLVLWSLMVGDWRCSGGTDRIKKKLFARLQNNDIIVLHDSGQTLGANQQAPMFMLEALKEFVKECRKQGIPFMRIDKRMQIDDQTNYDVEHMDLESQML